MQRPLTVVLGAVLLLALVSTAALHFLDPTALLTGARSEMTAAERAEINEVRARFRFRDTADYRKNGAPFTDAEVDGLIAQLDEKAALADAARESTSDVERRMGSHRMILDSYVRLLAGGTLSAAQEAGVMAQLDALAADHPGESDHYDNARFAIANLMPGKQAPDFSGTDFDGVEFELADYRGKVVALVFTGDWCPPCRGEYPYQRTLLEVTDPDEFVLLGVNSDKELQVAKDAKARENLPYRTWWDGHGERSTDGPIANLYRVDAWPTVYVIDEDGVIVTRGGGNARATNLITLAKELATDLRARRLAEESADGPAPAVARVAVSDIGFLPPAEYDTAGEPFTDETVGDLIATLDELLARPETQEDFESQAGLHLWRYATRLTMGYLTDEQTGRVVAHLDGLAAAHPEVADDLAATRFQVENLMLGKEAPNIVGNDFDDQPFELADYRGKVVALVFTGQWCGPCRSEYPYQRLLLEVTDADDFVLLGVNSDGELQTAQDAKVEERLDYRAWWDGHGEEPTRGPIATLYNVSGWPTIYVLDENGIVRNRGARQEELVRVARELVAEMKGRRAAADR